MKGQSRGVDRLHCANGITLDTRHLHQPADRVAGQAEVMLHADLRRRGHLHRRCAPQGRESARRHGTGDANFALTAHLGTGNTRALFVKQADCPCRKEECAPTIRARLFVVCDAIEPYHSRNDARRAIGRRGDHAPARGVFLVYGHGIAIEPVEQLFTLVRLGARGKLVPQVRRTPFDLQATRQYPALGEATVDALIHGLCNPVDTLERFITRSESVFVGQDQIRDRDVRRVARRQKLCCRTEIVRNLCAGIDAVALGLALELSFGCDETPAGRVICPLGQLASIGIEGGQLHAVGVQVGNDVPGQIDVRRRIEGDFTPPAKIEPFAGANLFERRSRFVRTCLVGCEPHQTQNAGIDRPVPNARKRQRTLQFDRDAGRSLELVRFCQRPREGAGDPHRTHRMRGRRTNPNSEDIEH